MLRELFCLSIVSAAGCFSLPGEPVVASGSGSTGAAGTGETGAATTAPSAASESSATSSAADDAADVTDDRGTQDDSESGDVPAVCGDGRVEGSEACDDANDIPADGCELDCSATAILDIGVGDDFSCVVTTMGHVRCWGEDDAGVLGKGTDGQHVGDDASPCTAPVLSFGPDKEVVQLATGHASKHACVRFADGTARCWGANAYGQLGAASVTDNFGDSIGEQLSEFPDLPFENVAAVEVGGFATCALIEDTPGEHDVYCWGRNEHGELGAGFTVAELPQALPGGPVDLGGAKVRQLSMGYNHSCVLLTDGNVRCWGYNGQGALGLGTVDDWDLTASVGDGVGNGLGQGLVPNSPALNVPLDDFEVTKIEVGTGASCALGDTAVRCWGGNNEGGLGYRFDQVSWDPEATCVFDDGGAGCVLTTPTTAVALGDLHGAQLLEIELGRRGACALDSAGIVRCWGRSHNGRHGYAIVDNVGHEVTPAQVYDALRSPGVDVGGTATRLAVGYDHSCVEIDDGTVRCWGDGQWGQLGYRDDENVGDNETPAQYYAIHRGGAVGVFEAEDCGR